MPRYPKPSKIEGSVSNGDYVTVAGKGGGNGRKSDWQKAMGIDWMQKKELKESIPPAFTEWIGGEVLLRLEPGLKLLPASSDNIRSRGYYLTKNTEFEKTNILYAKTVLRLCGSEITPYYLTSGYSRPFWGVYVIRSWDISYSLLRLPAEADRLKLHITKVAKHEAEITTLLL
jgi:hypothetical protein